MKKMTSAYANKLLRSLEEDKRYWENMELTSASYVVAVNEEPVIPEYEYTKVSGNIEELDQKIAKIKHALNQFNVSAKVTVGETQMSVDTILIKMAQYNKRKIILDVMRKRLPKSRLENHSYSSRNFVPEYEYINYDLELIKKEYERISDMIMTMQMALDKYNQTVEIEVDL